MSGGTDRMRTTLDWLAAHPFVQVRQWDDPGLQRCGVDARHGYVECFWLPILGPSAVLAARRFTDLLDRYPAGAAVEVVELGASLGIGTGTGRNTQINRTIARLVGFGFARIRSEHLEVRTMFPPVPDSMRRRLPLSLQDALTEQDRNRQAARP